MTIRNKLIVGTMMLVGAFTLSGCESTSVSDDNVTSTQVEENEGEKAIEKDKGKGNDDIATNEKSGSSGEDTEKDNREENGNGDEEVNEAREPGLLPEERDSITLGKLSESHIYYKEVIGIDYQCADYIQELSIYDKEIDDTFVVHISLPPTYDETKQYPLVVMTDGVWRLSDHPELRPLMVEGKIEDVILVSIGYPNDYDYEVIRERDLVERPGDFLHFIVDNLIPYLSEIYSVSEENTTLTGHSYGGYWAAYALLHSDTIGRNTFENYYIGSPSMQAHTGNKFLRNYESDYHKRNSSLNANVYVTLGGLEKGAVGSVEGFVEQLKEYEGINVEYEVIEGESHNTVFKPSIYNTLVRFYGKE